MKRKGLFISIGLFFLLFLGVLRADERQEPWDLLIVLDKSLSMEEEISAVKQYVIDDIIYSTEDYLKPDDYLVIITFYGQAVTFIAQKIENEASKQEISRKISTLKADGRFTDIGNALDKLQGVLNTLKSDNRMKFMLLITDGKQEAPPDSRYFSPDGSFNHYFLKNVVKTIQQKGWKIQVLGIGADTQAEALAKELSGGYTEVPDNATAQQLEEKTRDLTGTIRIIQGPDLTSVGSNGKSVLKIKVESSGYKETRTVIVDGITIEEATGSEMVLAAPLTFSVPADSQSSVNIPIQFSRDFIERSGSGDKSVKLIFTFSGDTPLIPAVSQTKLHIKGFLENNWWIFALIILAVAVIAVLVIFAAKGSASTAIISFKMIVEDMPLFNKATPLKHGHELFLLQAPGGYSLAKQAGTNAVGKIKADSKGLHLSVLNDQAFTVLGEIDDNILGHKYRVRNDKGDYRFVEFQEAP